MRSDGRCVLSSWSGGGYGDQVTAGDGQRTRITVTEYQRLVVTYSPPDDSVCVLCPPGTDPLTVLGAARLVVPDPAYQELAWFLGVSPGWPAAREAG